jgi:hypothetical protein
MFTFTTFVTVSALVAATLAAPVVVRGAHTHRSEVLMVHASP